MITTGEKFLKILNLLQKIPRYSGSSIGLHIESWVWTNIFIFSKITDSQTCALCKLEPEILLHLFFECTKVKQIWLDLEHWIEEKSGKVVIFSPSTVILGTLEKDIGLNIIILLVKRYIYQTSRKRRNIFFDDVRTYISNYYNVEKKLYQHISFEKRWSILEGIFNNNS